MRLIDADEFEVLEDMPTVDAVKLSRIRQEAYKQGYQDGKVDGYNLAIKVLSSHTETVCPMCPDCPDNCPLETDMGKESEAGIMDGGLRC